MYLNIIDLFYKGGWLMWPILLLGILSLSVFIERNIYLFYTKISSKKLYSFLNILKEKKEEPLKLLNRLFFDKINKNEILKILQLYFSSEISQRDSIIKREGEILIKKLNKRISLLLLNSQIAPLLGLLGTVLGMIESFQTISNLESQVAPSIIASGIWVAMLTTAFGLIIAIPSYIFYSILESNIEKRIDMLNYTLLFLEELEKKENQEVSK